MEGSRRTFKYTTENMLEFQKQNLKTELEEVNRKIDELKLQSWLDVQTLKQLINERESIQARLDFKS